MSEESQASSGYNTYPDDVNFCQLFYGCYRSSGYNTYPDDVNSLDFQRNIFSLFRLQHNIPMM